VFYQFDDLFHDNAIFSPHPTFAPRCPAPLGDLNCDGAVNITDLGILLADFGNQNAFGPGDVNGDGDTDITDLGILLANFGA
jgi:hypothetical protein